MGFLDNVKDALRGAVSTREPKGDAATPPTTAAQATDVPEPPISVPAPVEEAPEPVTEKFETYTVKTGDTLGSICARQGVSYQEITRLNQIENPDLIFPGQVFQIPKK